MMVDEVRLSVEGYIDMYRDALDIHGTVSIYRSLSPTLLTR